MLVLYFHFLDYNILPARTRHFIFFLFRFGKTISVSMFAAALLYSAASVELSIYSTCKRISQKLLRNVMKFLSLIHEGLGTPEFKEIRCNMEELVVQGPEGTSDVRVVNSYPSKASHRHAFRRGANVLEAEISPAERKCFKLSVRCSKVSSSWRARPKWRSR